MLTVEFYGYRVEVDKTDLDNCMRKVNDEVREQLRAGRAQISMGASPYVYIGDQVTLYLSPGEDLTWSKWSLAPAAIKRFVLDNGLKGTQFILLWHGLGPVGYGQLVSTSEMGSSMTATSSATPNAYPDPFDTHLDVLDLTVEFYGYRGRISPEAMRNCIAAADNDIAQHAFAITEPMTLVAPRYSYSAGEVNLFLAPTETLTWYKWAILPTLIEQFVTANGLKGTQFIILEPRLGPVGYGQLTNTSTSLLSLPG